MIPTSRTSIVYNAPSKLLGLPSYYYRLRTCDTNLTTNTPANQYQRLKLIQNTVRVYASLYTANLAPLSAYQNPGPQTQNVCWNQMSDRVVPSVQKTVVPTGTNCALNRRTTSVTSSRPGCQSPGGVGCDIKHNSYDRYLNRLKGKGPLRRGKVPADFGTPFIPFNPAYPVYGAKTLKTNIVTGCDCIINSNSNSNSIKTNENNIHINITNNTTSNKMSNTINSMETSAPVLTNKQTIMENNIQIYNNPLYQPYSATDFSFQIGEEVFAIQSGNNYYTRAVIEYKYNNLAYLIQFDNGVSEIQTVNKLLIYYPCNCGGKINSQTYPSGFLVTTSTPSEFFSSPIYPTYIPGEALL